MNDLFLLTDYGKGLQMPGKTNLSAKSADGSAKMEEGEGHRQKLLEIVANCEELKQLPPTNKATVFMRKNLIQTITELKKTEGFVNGVIPAVTVQQVVKDDEVLELLINPILFPSNRRGNVTFVLSYIKYQ